MISRYINWQILSRKSYWWVICVTIFIVSLSTGLKNLDLASDYKIFFDKNDVDLLRLEHMQEIYSETENIFIMIEPPESTVFTTDSISLLFSLTNELWQTPHVSRVDSITNYSFSRADGDDILIEELFYNQSDITPAKVDLMKEFVLNEKDLLDKLITRSGDVTAINLTVRLPEDDIKAATLAVNDAVKSEVTRLRKHYPDYTFSVSGIVTMNGAFINAAKRDFITLIPIMMLLVLVAAGIILGSLKAASIVFLTLLLSFTGALGLAGWLGITLSAPSISAPIIMFTVIVASSIHILVYVRRRQSEGASPNEAVIDSYIHNASPIVLSHLTTVVGFLSMNCSDSPPFRDLGNIVVFGVLLSLLQIFSVLPLLLKSIKFSKKSALGEHVATLPRLLSSFVIRHRVGLVFTMGSLALIAAMFTSKSVLNDNLIRYFDRSVEFRQEADRIDAHFSGLYGIDYSIDSGADRGIFNYGVLQFAEEFEQWLLDQPYVVTVDSPIHRIKDLNKLIHSDDHEYYQLPHESDAAAQNFLLYEMSLPFGRDTNHYLTLSKDSLKVTARFKNMGSTDVINVEKKIDSWLAHNTPSEISVTYTSPALIFSHIGSRSIISLLEGAIIALITISFALLFVFRSVLSGLVSLIPNILPIAAAFGVWQILGGEISMGLAGVAAMTIGIVVDDTVHFLFQYMASVRRGASPEEAVRYTFDHTMPAILISSILLAMGFMLLSSSSFEKNVDLGILTSITIILALLFDLLLLPAIAMLCIKPKVKRSLKTATHQSSVTAEGAHNA